MRVSCFQVASAALAAFTLVRALALFLESYSAERAEHSGDDDLARLCSEGLAPTSIRMRATCLDLIRARATPLILKAVLRATRIGYDEFAANILSPRSVGAAALFLLMGVATPMLRVLRFAFPNNRDMTHPMYLDEESEQSSQRILYLGDPYPNLRGWARVKKTWAGDYDLKQIKSPSYIEDISEETIWDNPTTSRLGTGSHHTKSE